MFYGKKVAGLKKILKNLGFIPFYTLIFGQNFQKFLDKGLLEGGLLGRGLLGWGAFGWEAFGLGVLLGLGLGSFWLERFFGELLFWGAFGGELLGRDLFFGELMSIHHINVCLEQTSI